MDHKPLVIALIIVILPIVVFGIPAVDNLHPSQDEIPDSEETGVGDLTKLTDEKIKRVPEQSGRKFNLFSGFAKKSPRTMKCNIIGNLAIKNECVKYYQCPAYGANANTRYCQSGKFFDHKKRTCVGKDAAECTGLCPNDSTQYDDPNDDTYYLQCKDGIPYPTSKKNANQG